MDAKSTRLLALALAALAVLLSTSALLASLRGRLQRSRRARQLSDRERLAAALAPITINLKPLARPPYALPPDFDRDAFLAGLPPDLNLSGAVIEDREEERKASR